MAVPKNLGDQGWKGSKAPKRLGSQGWKGSSLPSTMGDQSWKGSRLPRSLGVNRGSGIIHPTPDTSGRNNSIGLPKVSGGMPAHPSHINNLSAAVDKTTIRTVAGGLVKQNNGGTTISFPNRAEDFPFKVVLVGSYVQMSVGSIFWYGSQTCPISQYFTSSTSTSTIPRGGEFNLPPDSKSAFDNSIAVSSSADQYATNFVFPLGSETEPRIIWMDMTPSPPQLRNTPKDEFVSSSGVPIAYIEDGIVIQLLKSDIFARKPLGLQASVSKESEQFYIKITAGHINNVVPTLGGTAITEATAKLSFSGNKFVWLKCNRSTPPAAFPTSVEVELGDFGVYKESTDSYGYVLLAAVSLLPSGQSASATNFLAGSLWGEAHKFNPLTTTYYFYAV